MLRAVFVSAQLTSDSAVCAQRCTSDVMGGRRGGAGGGCTWLLFVNVTILPQFQGVSRFARFTFAS